jgi:hypothetical protein
VTDAAAAAWLEVLGALVADAAHAVNNVLNGAAVNLGVVTSRLSSPKVADATGEALAGRTVGFAADAATGLEAVSELVQSVVSLARPLPVSVDPARLVRDVVRVASAGCESGTVGIGVELRDPVLPSEGGPVVRLAIASGVRTLMRGGTGGMVSWVIRDIVLSRPAGSGGEPIVPARVMRILADTGVSVRAEADIVTLRV